MAKDGTSKKRKNRSEAVKVTMRKQTEARKDARRKAQAAREAINKVNRELGEPTPWEAARAARKARRAAARRERKSAA